MIRVLVCRIFELVSSRVQASKAERQRERALLSVSPPTFAQIVLVLHSLQTLQDETRLCEVELAESRAESKALTDTLQTSLMVGVGFHSCYMLG